MVFDNHLIMFLFAKIDLILALVIRPTISTFFSFSWQSLKLALHFAENLSALKNVVQLDQDFEIKRGSVTLLLESHNLHHLQASS